MKLLFLEQHPRFIGGSERMSLSLCRHAIARGHEAWLVHAEDGDMVSAYAGAGAVCRRVPVVPMAIRKTNVAWRSFRRLTGLLRRERIDVAFTSQVNYVSLLAPAGKWTGARTAVHLGLVYDFPSPLFRAGMRRMDLGIAPSAHTADGWRGRDWPARSLRVIPNGVDTTVFCPGDGRSAARGRLGLSPAAAIVAYVGRLHEDKGVFTLLRAFARHRHAGGGGVLLFVGQAANGEVEQLRALAAAERLPDDGWQVRPATPHPEDVYRAADLVVTPSQWDEPFGLAPLEAMACGTMVVVSDRGILPEFVAPVGRDAVFASGDPASLAGRLSSWLGDGALREAAAERLAAHTRRTYAFERCGDGYLDAFRSVLSS